MKIYLITSNPEITTATKADLEKIGELTVIDGLKLSSEQIIHQAADAEILIVGSSGVEKISQEVLQGLPKLKMIATLTVGTDWVDLVTARKLNIIVSNTKGANSESVAEHAWGMILDLSKRITEFDRDVRKTGAYKFTNYTGHELYGKTLGIIGLGNIGQKVARIASGFNMRTLGSNKNHLSVPGVDLVDLKKLLIESDVISICAPLTPETTDLISDQEIALMKDGVIIVNTSREQITNKQAILKAVASGKIFGFGIETEIMKPIPPDDPYLNFPRIIVTPYNAFNTIEANIKTFELAIKNVTAFVSGHPQNVVNP